MSDTPRPPDPTPQDDEDRAFREWLKRRPPQDDQTTPSVAFTEMMREAAARRTGAEAAKAQIRQATHRAQATLPEDEAEAEPTPAEPDAAAPPAAEEPPRRRRKAQSPAPAPEAASEPEKRPTARQRAQARAERMALEDARPASRGRRAVSMIGGFVRSLLVILVAAALTATVFTWFTPPEFIRADVRDELSADIAAAAAITAPTAAPTANFNLKIGVVSGHRGPQNDPGAVCADGLTENSINYSVAQRVVDSLQARGYDVVLLDEFDARLDNFQADALVSIHANTCQSFGEIVSGYLISAPAARITARGNDQVLVDCVSRHYTAASGLQRRDGVTVDMTDYHTFREIGALTPAAIIELGFMLADREVLTADPERLANGILDGILCFIEPGSPQSRFALPTPTPDIVDGATAVPFVPLPTLAPGI